MILEKRHITIFTFEHFWNIFHYKNNVRQIDKTRCRNLWYSCNFAELKKLAIKDVEKTKLSAYEYLKIKLK